MKDLGIYDLFICVKYHALLSYFIFSPLVHIATFPHSPLR